MTKIDVISSCLVKMANNAASASRMELTPWDLQMLLLDPIQKGILFHKPAHQSQESLIHHLENSLSRTLDFFPPLSGRIATVDNEDNTTSFFIDCNDAGVEFVHAVADNVSVSDILEPTYIPEIVPLFFPLNGIPNCEGVSKPLLGVQVTELVDGLFIACTANHCIVDGVSFWHFFNSWSEISRGFETISKSPVFERWFPNNANCPPIPLPTLDKKNMSVSSSPLLERAFHFSRESLAKLKSKTNVEGVSSLQALSAHLWQSITRLRRADYQNSALETGLMMLVGARARIPLPEGYFGNAVHVGAIAISETEMLEKGLGFAAMKVNELVGEQTREAVIKSAEDWVKNPILYRKGNFGLTISSSPRHNVYGNDFGWGKPIAVRSGKAQKFDGKMTLFPAAVAGGIDVHVCLAPETLQALGDDPEFMGV
ncbi:hypothetical protein ACS0TY_035470 [Phlomoides rotata]